MSTYVPIQTIRITSDTSTITFTGIPQTYTDLVVVVNIASTGDDLVPTVRVGNGTIDSGSNYSQTTGGMIYGAGIVSFRDSSDTRMRFGRAGFSTTQPTGVSTLHFQNYSNTTTNKTILARTSAFDRSVVMCTGTWRSTSAINTIQFTEYSGGNYVSGSTFTLYGIGSGSPKAFGGDRVVTDGTYWYHAFTSSGRFEPVQALNADVLVIAGGGGGGSGNNSGGGGAGGLLAFTSQSLTAQNYTITVGAGGATGNPNGVVGNDSQFGSLTLVKGGGRGAGDPNTGGNGGSGGGNGWSNSGTAGQPTSGQGFAGGPGENIPAGPNYFGGGGGGAGEAGNTDAIGQGGDGVSTYSSWGVATSTGQDISGTRWFAGGGGGSGQSNSVNRVGGDGGGGRGAGTSGAAQAGTANTGGGGGGSGNSAGNTGAAGGSGIVIVRYAV